MSYEPTPVERAIYAWLADTAPTGALVIYSGQDAPRPPTTFVSFQIIRDASVGEAETELREDDEGEGEGEFEERASQLRDVTVRVQSYGPQAYAALRSITARWELPSVAAQNLARGLAVRRMGAMLRVPQILKQVTEDRWQVQADCYVVEVVSQSELALAEIVAAVAVEDIDGDQ